LTTAEPESHRVEIEGPRPLSASRLWDIERRFYERVGPLAWTTRGVPSYITTNPYIARCYARVVAAFLRDTERAGAGPAEGEPSAYVVELGAGAAMFAFRFVRALRAIIRRSPQPERRVVYVLADFTDSNRAFWRSHPQLAPLVEEGWVDFARFDASAAGPLHLEHAGVTLGPGPGAVPLVVVANYFFDSISQDLFGLEAGELVEHVVGLSEPEGADPDHDDYLAELDLSWSTVPVARPRYDDVELEALLDFYRQELASTTFLVPTGALACLAWFADFAERCLFLVGDRGYDTLADLLDQPGPQIGLHGGAFSLPLNGHALAWHVERRGGEALHPASRHGSLDVAAFVLGLPGAQAAETRSAYVGEVDEAGPDDFYCVRQLLCRSAPEMTLEELLAVLRTSASDPDTLRSVLPDAVRLVAGAPEGMYPEVHRALDLLWDNHFALPDGYDLAFDIGSLLYGMSRWEDALVYLARSQAEFGPHPSTSFNRGMCCWHLNRLPEAAEAMQATLDGDPSFERARVMKVRIAGALRRSPGTVRP
jgi:hypothetical protein